MQIEITHSAFRALVPVDKTCHKAEFNEANHRAEYNVHDTKVIAVNCYLTGTTQYFIQDINA